MAKFCGTCGFQNDDNAKICGNCGAMFPETKTPMNNPLESLKNMTPEKKEKVKKYGTYACAGVAGLIVLIIVISILSGFGAKGTAKKFMKAYLTNKPSKAASLYYLSGDDVSKDDVKEQWEDRCEFMRDALEEEFDGKPSVSIKVSKKTKLSDRAVKALNERLEDNDAPTIKKAVYFKVRVTAKRKGDSETETFGVLVVKQKGKWRVMDIGSYNLDYYKDLGKTDSDWN